MSCTDMSMQPIFDSWSKLNSIVGSGYVVISDFLLVGVCSMYLCYTITAGRKSQIVPHQCSVQWWWLLEFHHNIWCELMRIVSMQKAPLALETLSLSLSLCSF